MLEESEENIIRDLLKMTNKNNLRQTSGVRNINARLQRIVYSDKSTQINFQNFQQPYFSEASSLVADVSPAPAIFGYQFVFADNGGKK